MVLVLVGCKLLVSQVLMALGGCRSLLSQVLANPMTLLHFVLLGSRVRTCTAL